MFRDDLSVLPNEIIQKELKKPLLGLSSRSPYKINSISGFITLPQVSKRFHGLFASEYKPASDFLRQLLSHSALGEWEQAEEIWKICPDLLSCRGTICHPNRTYIAGQASTNIPFQQNLGRYQYVDRTAWQIAVMNEEYEEAERMGEFMTDEEKQNQFAEIFPDGEIKKQGFDLEVATQLLQNVFDAIASDGSIDGDDLTKMNQATRDALTKLYQYAKPNSNQKHQTGLVFDASFYLAAQKMYDTDACYANKFKYFWDKYSFWCIRVEEMLAGCLGTGYLRAHAPGIDHEPAPRRGCFLHDGSSYFAFRRSSLKLPGVSFFVGPYGMECDASRATRAHGYSAGLATPTALIYKSFYEAKLEERDNFREQFMPAAAPACNSLK